MPGIIQAAPQLTRLSCKDAATTCGKVVDILRRDGGVILTGFVNLELTRSMSSEMRPLFDADGGDQSGFFPSTTRRATGLLGASDGCVELATNKLWIDVCNTVLTSTCRPWYGERRATFTAKPILTGTFGFQIHPGSRAQELHRDDR